MRTNYAYDIAVEELLATSARYIDRWGGVDGGELSGGLQLHF